MSGGHFDYIDQRAKYEIFGYLGDEQQRNVFEDREISELVWDVFELIHDFDYYKSCDTCKDVCFYGAEYEPKATEAWNRRANNDD